jgi:hypothetical protein
MIITVLVTCLSEKIGQVSLFSVTKNFNNAKLVFFKAKLGGKMFVVNNSGDVIETVTFSRSLL